MLSSSSNAAQVFAMPVSHLNDDHLHREATSHAFFCLPARLESGKAQLHGIAPCNAQYTTLAEVLAVWCYPQISTDFSEPPTTPCGVYCCDNGNLNRRASELGVVSGCPDP